MDENSQPPIAAQGASSFLLRVWLEPSEEDDAGGAVRGYLRNLGTGEQQVFGTPERLTAAIRGQIRWLAGQGAETEEDESLSAGSAP